MSNHKTEQQDIQERIDIDREKLHNFILKEAPKLDKHLSFSQALILIKAGERVQREKDLGKEFGYGLKKNYHWDKSFKEKIIGYYNNPFLKSFSVDYFSEEDILATDWMLMDKTTYE